MDPAKLKKRSVGSSEITFRTNKPTSTTAAINPYEPFQGVDGRKYLIGYKQPLNRTTNCYAFAMGWQLAAQNKYDDYVPGFLSGNPFSASIIARLVAEDVKAVGRSVFEVIYDIPEKLPDGDGYWIKCLQCREKGENEIHFMRKDKKSGRWIHKMGWEKPPKVVVRNLEFADKMETAFQMMGGVPDGISKKEIEAMVKTMIPKEMYTGITLVRSELETNDSADYVSFGEAEEINTYRALWVMRVSEP